MPPRTRAEKLFGLACVRITLLRRGLRPEDNEIYRGALQDLGCDDGEVLRYLDTHRAAVEAKVAGSTRPER
jgi:hypothetical protein